MTLKNKYQRNYGPNCVEKQLQASENDVKLSRKSNKPYFMEKYNIKYKDIALYFGYNSANSFNNASRKLDILNEIAKIIVIIEKHNNKKSVYNT